MERGNWLVEQQAKSEQKGAKYIEVEQHSADT
jgi:hypothetical protein